MFFTKELERLGFEVNQQVARLAPAAPGEAGFGDADFQAGCTFVEQYFAYTGERRHLDGAASEYPEDANRDGDVDIRDYLSFRIEKTCFNKITAGVMKALIIGDSSMLPKM